MAIQSLTTQAGFEDLQNALAQIANNLNSHVNLTLGKAHSVQLFSGYVDSSGNDLTKYQNAAGIVVGTMFAVFYVNGVTYYAPANPTALAGQPATTGQLNPDVTESVPVSTPGGSSLVTDYISVDVASGTNTNNLLIAHTQLPFQTAHSQILAFLQNTYDSAGTVIGRYVIQFVYGGVQYSIPCDTRLGGPPQGPRNPTIPVTESASSSNDYQLDINVPIQCAVAGGQQPFTFQWQWSPTVHMPTWNTLPPATNGNFIPPGWSGDGIRYNLPGTFGPTTSLSILQLIRANPGGGTSQTTYIQCIVSNSAGSATSNICAFTMTEAS